MLLRFLLFILFLISNAVVVAQADSVAANDTIPLPADSLLVAKPVDTAAAIATVRSIRFDTALFKTHPFYRFDRPVRLIISEKKWEGKETYFYIVLGLLVIFALIKNSFSRYLSDLSKLFFRTTIKHRQVKDQLMQAPLPSLLLNILFIVAAAVFINLVLQHYGLGTSYGFWLLLLYSALALTLIYAVKFITLKICGWLFRLSEATDAYIFIVFTTNKIIGIVLLPLIVLLAFTAGQLKQVGLTLSLLLVGCLFLYRFFLSYMTIHRQVKIQFFHFFLYLCAFEIIPLLLINKVLFHFLS